MYDGISDDELGQPRRPKRTTAPSARVTCADNAADLELSSHRQAQAATRPLRDDNAAQHRKRKGVDTDALLASAESDSDSQPKKRSKGKNHTSALATSSTLPTEAPLGPDETGPDGLLKDVEVIDIDAPTRKPRADRTQDIEFFFSPPYLGKNDKKYRDCNACTKLQKKRVALINEATTLRRHQQANHPVEYRKWASDNHFNSMLPEDAKRRRDLAREQAAAASTSSLGKQPSLDSHLVPKEPVVRYSDSNFRETAIKWIIETDQPIEALQHPSFKNMIDMATRAPNGVNLPGSKTTRQAIVELFLTNLATLKRRLNSPIVNGRINLTCDAWQASNTDGYFAVTGAWVEETSPRVWALQTGLLGFTQLNNAHNGIRLGQALFKVVRRTGILHKVGYVTCDNASNNDTMLAEFGRLLAKHGHSFQVKQRRLRCMAHIVNLATQAFLGTYSTTAHYDPSMANAAIEPVCDGESRDEIGLIRAIAVKARSSSQRKELFKTIQTGSAKQLLVDMKVRWSSTFTMLQRALELKQEVSTFIERLAWKDRQDSIKYRKLLDLQLSEIEWDRVRQVLAILVHAENAQHAFSTEHEPTLHAALPALEALFKAWTTCTRRKKYSVFSDALEAALAKISQYYDRTASSDAHIIAMILDPQQKLNYIHTNWGEDLYDEALQHAETIYKERYQTMYPNPADGPQPMNRTYQITSRNPKLQALFDTLLDDDPSDSDDDMSASNTTSRQCDDPTRPWLRGFQEYLATQDNLGDLSIIQWWGINSTQYPVWASLARDYLSVMSSSVSAERVFSSAGITISKRRNRLKRDIVEALQFQKCAAKSKLLFREDPTLLAETTMQGNLDEINVDGGESDDETADESEFGSDT